MANVVALLGLLLVGIVIWDVLVTVLSTEGAGFLTRGWTKPWWALLLAVHRRRPIHSVLSLAGPAMVLFGILIWYALLGLGWFLVFASHSGSVVRSSDQVPVAASRIWYFVTSTQSGLGYGDLVPSSFPWTIAATTSTLLGTMVLTASLSYILSVLVPAAGRKALASGVHALGDSPSEVVDRLQLHDERATLKPYVATLVAQLGDLAAKHTAYPILRHFHAPQLRSAPSRAVLLLSDATFLMQQRTGALAPPDNVLSLLRASVEDYAGTKESRKHSGGGEDEQTRHLRSEAEALGVSVDQAYLDAEITYLDVRSRLVAACDDDGWPVTPSAT